MRRALCFLRPAEVLAPDATGATSGEVLFCVSDEFLSYPRLHTAGCWARRRAASTRTISVSRQGEEVAAPLDSRARAGDFWRRAVSLSEELGMRFTIFFFSGGHGSAAHRVKLLIIFSSFPCYSSRRSDTFLFFSQFFSTGPILTRKDPTQSNSPAGLFHCLFLQQLTAH